MNTAWGGQGRGFRWTAMRKSISWTNVWWANRVLCVSLMTTPVGSIGRWYEEVMIATGTRVDNQEKKQEHPGEHWETWYRVINSQVRSTKLRRTNPAQIANQVLHDKVTEHARDHSWWYFNVEASCEPPRLFQQVIYHWMPWSKELLAAPGWGSDGKAMGPRREGRGR